LKGPIKKRQQHQSPLNKPGDSLMKPQKNISPKVFLLLIFVMCWATLAISVAQEEADSTKRAQLKYAVDWNRFRYADSLIYLEYYMALPRNLLTFVPDSSGFTAEFQVSAVLSQQDSVIAQKIWKNRTDIDSLAQLTGTQRLYAVNHFAAEKGEYNLQLKISDSNVENEKAYDIPVLVDAFPQDLCISDMQLATQINRNDQPSSLNKNGFWIYPNPTRLYGIGLPILYSYSEIYNFTEATSDSGNYYKVRYKVLDSDGGEAKKYKEKLKKKPGKTAVEVNGVNVVTLVSGPYYIVMEVEDQETGKVVETRQKFFVYREGDYAEGGAAFKKQEQLSGTGSAGLDAGRYDSMEEKDLDSEIEWCRYISTKDERNTYKKLNLDGKRTFIKEFWARRDQSPTTPINEFKRNYLNSVEYANQAYRGTFRAGWRTDRGRVMLVYGKADEIERFPFSSDNKAYEVWHFFSLQGGITFIFVDRRDMGDYELVHSTARGELYDPEWIRWINPSGGGSGFDSRY
jgi:GWxTD domain-containing protein